MIVERPSIILKYLQVYEYSSNFWCRIKVKVYTPRRQCTTDWMQSWTKIKWILAANDIKLQATTQRLHVRNYLIDTRLCGYWNWKISAHAVEDNSDGAMDRRREKMSTRTSGRRGRKVHLKVMWRITLLDKDLYTTQARGDGSFQIIRTNVNWRKKIVVLAMIDILNAWCGRLLRGEDFCGGLYQNNMIEYHKEHHSWIEELTQEWISAKIL